MPRKTIMHGITTAIREASVGLSPQPIKSAYRNGMSGCFPLSKKCLFVLVIFFFLRNRHRRLDLAVKEGEVDFPVASVVGPGFECHAEFHFFKLIRLSQRGFQLLLRVR